MTTGNSGMAMCRRIGLRAGLMISTALTASALLATSAHAGSWTGATGDWFDPANWDSGVPDIVTHATLDNGGTVQIEAPGAISQSFAAGFNSGTSGTVEVSGSDASWANTFSIYLGYDGTGTLTLREGGSVTAQGAYLGYESTGLGELNVDGEGSLLDVTGLLVGAAGEGRLTITNGAAVNSTSGDIGSQAGSTGSVTVDGEGSSWHPEFLTVGIYGEGRLDIANGGSVTTDFYANLAQYSGSAGTVTVDGEGSSWISSGLTIGYFGDGSLDITNGGVVDNGGETTISFFDGTGSVTVDGEGSTFNAGTNLTVGQYGDGTLTITNGGTVNAGTVQAGMQAGGSATILVDGDGSSLNMTSGDRSTLGGGGDAVLTVSNGGSVVVGGLLRLADIAGSSATINIGAPAGEDATAAGTFAVDSIDFGSGDGVIVFNHTDTDFELASNLSRSGTLRQIGSGTTTLSGSSGSFWGTTAVEAGALIVNGVLGGTMDVGAARLGGAGTVSNVTLGSGSVIAPGASAGAIGTLSVLGDLTFNAGSTYEVEVNPASAASDLIHVTGTAYLNNASVEHVGASGTYPWYMTRTILTADGGIDGAFGSVTSDYAFLIPILSYYTHDVRMSLLRNDINFSGVAASPNQTGVAGVLNGFAPGNPIYDQIILMTEDEARAAFNALSGEAYGSTDSATLNSVQQIRNVLQARMQMFADGSSKNSSGVQVAALGDFVPSVDSLSGNQSAVWGQAFGSWGVSDASANVAKLDRRSSGFLGGADKPVGEATRVGVAVGYSHSDFGISARSSSGDSDNFHVAGYASTGLGKVDLASTLSYTYGRAEAERSVTVGLVTNNLAARYDTHTVQASVEAATDIDMKSIVLMPFAGLSATYVYTQGFTETGGPAALTVASSDNTTGASSLGLRLRHQAGKVALSGSLGWDHTFGEVDPASRVAFASAPASSFLVRGAPIAKDTLAVGAQIRLALTDRTSLSFSYTGDFASQSRDQGLKSEVRFEF